MVERGCATGDVETAAIVAAVADYAAGKETQHARPSVVDAAATCAGEC